MLKTCARQGQTACGLALRLEPRENGDSGDLRQEAENLVLASLTFSQRRHGEEEE
jgi:hypothetical protein